MYKNSISLNREILRIKGLNILAKLILNTAICLSYSKRDWEHITFYTKWIADEFGTTELRVVRAIEKLQEKGYFKVKYRNIEERYSEVFKVALEPKALRYSFKHREDKLEKPIEEDISVADAVKNARANYRFNDTRQIKN